VESITEIYACSDVRILNPTVPQLSIGFLKLNLICTEPEKFAGKAFLIVNILAPSLSVQSFGSLET